MALGMLGRADEALVTLATLDAEVSRLGAWRWTPRPLNLRGWIVRHLGELNEADDLTQAAMEAARPLGLAEPLANALLDLASGRLLAGDLDAAGRLLTEADPLADVEHAFRWRHVMRARLLRAQLDLALERAESAFVVAESLAADAAAIGTPRYEVQARVTAAIAAHRIGGVVDHDALERLLMRLDHLAGLESWRITADVAQEFGVGQWETLARRRVGELRACAGPYADALGREADRRLS